MRRGPRGTTYAAAFALALAVGPALGAAVQPIPPGAAVPLHHVGFFALEERLQFDGLYAETVEGSRFFVRDQMIGVLALLEAAHGRPAEASQLRSRAASLWSAAEAGYIATAGFYAKTLPPPDPTVCIDLDTNSWALRAAHALAQEGSGDVAPVPRDRLGDLRELLGNFLFSRTSNGRPLCPPESAEIPVHLRPMLLLALLETHGQAPGAHVDSGARSYLQRFIDDDFDSAFGLPAAIYSASLNAQMLVVTMTAFELFGDASFRTTRDALARWLQDVSVQRDGARTFASNVDRSSGRFEPIDDSPEGQVWTAYALSRLQRVNASLVDPALVKELTRTYLLEYWSGTGGGFAEPGSLVYFDFNALPAVLSAGAPLDSASLEPSTVAFIVPSRGAFSYPAPEDAGAESLYLQNQWAAQFGLGPLSVETSVVLPAAQLGAFNLSARPSAFFPAPRVARTTGARVDLPTIPVPQDPSILWFTAPPSSRATAYRLDAYVPVRPVSAEFSSSIEVVLRSNALEGLTIGTLQLELDATTIQIRSVTVNDDAFPSIEVIELDATERLERPHMRVLLRDVHVPAGSDTQIVLGYVDILRPVVEDVAITRDLLGVDPLPQGTPIPILEGEMVYVRAKVTDNGALRSVQLRYRLGDQNLDLRMSEVPDQLDVYAVKLPTGSGTGKGVVQVVAIDAAGTGNLNQSAPLDIEIKNPLLSGSIVLFVFSGTLFVASFIIWLKVRRRTG